MWEEIRRAVFDAATATGLNAGFLGNLIAETYGLLFGAVISVLIANLLDSRRETRRQNDHKVRAVNRWIKNHYEMLLSVREAGGQGDTERRKAERRDKVRAAIQNAEGIKEDYSEALDDPKITGEFMKYVQALERFAGIVFEHAVATDEAREISAAAYSQLNVLVETTSPRALKKIFRAPLDAVRESARLELVGGGSLRDPYALR
jgi:hypothetical protein